MAAVRPGPVRIHDAPVRRGRKGDTLLKLFHTTDHKLIGNMYLVTSFGFANAVLPLQIGAPDVAFPRLNALSYWLYLFGGRVAMFGLLTSNGAADFGWIAYAPLSRAEFSPNVGGNLWAAGLIIGGLSTILGAVNMLTTVVCLRAPGMTMFRMPIFTWNIVFTSILVLIASRSSPRRCPGRWPTGCSARTCSTRATAARSCCPSSPSPHS